MIEKTRRKFIILATTALSVAMFSVVFAINITNFLEVRLEMRETLSFLCRFSGPPPVELDQENKEAPRQYRHPWNLISESRYFVVRRNSDGSTKVNNQLHDASYYTNDDLVVFAEQAAASGQPDGRIHTFVWEKIVAENQTTAFVFLDTEPKYRQVKRLLQFSVFACALGIAASWFIVFLYSGRIVRPVVENVNRMKRFITDASHELKTPLTVISANMDVLTLDQPGNTWIRSTQKQVANLRRMVDQMVYLTRIEEADAPLTRKRIALHDLVTDAADPFISMAEFGGKSVRVQSAEGLFVSGDEDALHRLITILLDNAVKYAPEGAGITITSHAKGKHAVIETVNPVEAELTEVQCRRLFDRFYRIDESRNKQKHSGYGIGLAIASAIAERHGGLMEAHMSDGQLVIRCTLPLIS